MRIWKLLFFAALTGGCAGSPQPPVDLDLGEPTARTCGRKRRIELKGEKVVRVQSPDFESYLSIMSTDPKNLKVSVTECSSKESEGLVDLLEEAPQRPNTWILPPSRVACAKLKTDEAVPVEFQFCPSVPLLRQQLQRIERSPDGRAEAELKEISRTLAVLGAPSLQEEANQKLCQVRFNRAVNAWRARDSQASRYAEDLRSSCEPKDIQEFIKKAVKEDPLKAACSEPALLLKLGREFRNESAAIWPTRLNEALQVAASRIQTVEREADLVGRFDQQLASGEPVRPLLESVNEILGARRRYPNSSDCTEQAGVPSPLEALQADLTTLSSQLAAVRPPDCSGALGPLKGASARRTDVMKERMRLAQSECGSGQVEDLLRSRRPPEEVARGMRRIYGERIPVNVVDLARAYGKYRVLVRLKGRGFNWSEGDSRGLIKEVTRLPQGTCAQELKLLPADEAARARWLEGFSSSGQGKALRCALAAWPKTGTDFKKGHDEAILQSVCDGQGDFKQLRSLLGPVPRSRCQGRFQKHFKRRIDPLLALMRRPARPSDVSKINEGASDALRPAPASSMNATRVAELRKAYDEIAAIAEKERNNSRSIPELCGFGTALKRLRRGLGGQTPRPSPLIETLLKESCPESFALPREEQDSCKKVGGGKLLLTGIARGNDYVSADVDPGVRLTAESGVRVLPCRNLLFGGVPRVSCQIKATEPRKVVVRISRDTQFCLRHHRHTSAGRLD